MPLLGLAETLGHHGRLEEAEALVKRALNVMEKAVGAPVDIISTGPDRNETIVLNDPFDGARGI